MGRTMHRIGIGEGAGEFLEQITRARVAVGLEDHVDAAIAALARCGQGGADLGGMVAVVVDDGDAAGRRHDAGSGDRRRESG